MSFSFVGTIPASKSLLNRLLVCQAYFPHLQILGDSEADDVQLMQQLIADVSNKNTSVDCGYAGTVFRFSALMLARQPGQWCLNVEEELKMRPHNGLYQILGQLGVDWEWKENQFLIQTEGWRIGGDGIYISAQTSSQFLSSLILNSWLLPEDLFISIPKDLISKSYFEMTYNLVKQLGMSIQWQQQELVVFKNSQLQKQEWVPEPDMSSAFAVAAVAAVAGDVAIQKFPADSLQPDVSFVNFLQTLGVDVEIAQNVLKVSVGNVLRGGTFDLSLCPDLFPSLAVLCALAEGNSRLYGAPQLKFKESNRIDKIVELLKPLGRELKPLDDGLEISGVRKSPKEVNAWTFNPVKDHRLAMAAAVLLKHKYAVTIEDPQVVSKSLPEFWSMIGVQL